MGIKYYKNFWEELSAFDTTRTSWKIKKGTIHRLRENGDLIRRRTHRPAHRHQDDLISLVLFFQNKKSMLQWILKKLGVRMWV
jgi:hypothetical protein